MSDDWSDLMWNTCVIENVASTDEAGNKTYGSPVTYRCRISGGIVGDRTLAGTEKISRPKVYFNEEVNVTIDSRITLTGFVPTQPAIIAVEHAPDETGKRFTTIVL